MFSRTLRAAPLRSRLVSRAGASRAISASPIARGVQEITRPAIETPLSLWNFTEEENMLRETGEWWITTCTTGSVC